MGSRKGFSEQISDLGLKGQIGCVERGKLAERLPWQRPHSDTWGMGTLQVNLPRFHSLGDSDDDMEAPWRFLTRTASAF